MSQGWSRAGLDVPVACANDGPGVRAVLQEVADGLHVAPDWEGKVLEQPEVWGVEAIGPDGVVVRTVLKTAPLEQWAVARELRERVKAAFDARGIEVGIPQQVVHNLNRGAAAPGATAPGADAVTLL